MSERADSGYAGLNHISMGTITAIVPRPLPPTRAEGTQKHCLVHVNSTRASSFFQDQELSRVWNQWSSVRVLIAHGNKMIVSHLMLDSCSGYSFATRLGSTTTLKLVLARILGNNSVCSRGLLCNDVCCLLSLPPRSTSGHCSCCNMDLLETARFRRTPVAVQYVSTCIPRGGGAHVTSTMSSHGGAASRW